MAKNKPNNAGPITYSFTEKTNSLSTNTSNNSQTIIAEIVNNTKRTRK